VLSFLQFLGLPCGCEAVDGVLSEVSQLLAGSRMQGESPAVESALGDAIVLCVGLADRSAGDSSSYTCGLSSTATACMLEMARSFGTGAFLLGFSALNSSSRECCTGSLGLLPSFLHSIVYVVHCKISLSL
jgi:hypothetical protein